MRQSNSITDAAFTNGYFYRFYNSQGQQVRNGFFSYLNNFSGEQEIIIASQETLTQDVNLAAGTGLITLQKNGAKVATFYPYTKNYQGRVNIAAKINQGYIRQIVTGAGIGGGPQVGVFPRPEKQSLSFCL